MLAIIVAIDKNNLIGNNNTIPWHLPADLAYFKKITTGNVVIMGRKTYQSIGKALPNRHNIVITRNKNFNADDCEIAYSINDVITNHQDKNIFIIGGANIYQQTINKANKLYITKIDASFNGDSYFPQFNKNEFKEVQNIAYDADKNNRFKYNLMVLERI